MITQARDLLTSAYGIMFSGKSASAKDLKEVVGQFEEAIRSLRSVRDSYLLDQPIAKNSDEIFYRTTMEIALSYYWQAIIARHTGAVKNGRATISASNAEKLAMDAYVEVSKHPNFGKDATLLYRMSSLASFRGWAQLSLSTAREAFNALSSDSRLSQNHYLRVKIPRHFGFLLWSEGFQLKRMSEFVGDRIFSVEEERDLYKDALRATLAVHCKEIEEWESDRDSRTTPEESALTANNILSYVFSYLDTGASWEEIERIGFKPSDINDYLRIISPGGINEVRSITFASTFRLAGHYFGDVDMIVQAANIVKTSKASSLSFARVDEYMYAAMIKEAENDLRKLRK